MNTEHTIEFMSDAYKLVGTLHLPQTANPPVVIGLHGLLANRQSEKQISLAKACNTNGWAYFRFDHRGCGDSQGGFAEVTTLQARCTDLASAISTIQAHPATGPIACLFGSSFGGTVVLAHSATHESPLLITYAAPVNSQDIMHGNIRDNNGRLPASSMLNDALAFDIAPRLDAVNNILVVHSQGDETVPPSHAEAIFAKAGDPKKRVIFKGGDHRMSDAAHQKAFETHVLEWIRSSVN